jgi:hypothetical protein
MLTYFNSNNSYKQQWLFGTSSDVSLPPQGLKQGTPSVLSYSLRQDYEQQTYRPSVDLRQKYCNHLHLPLLQKGTPCLTKDKFKPALCKQTEMIAEMHIPRLLRRPIFTAYSKMYKVNLKEVELPLRDYPTFCAFFTRRIKRNFPEA